MISQTKQKGFTIVELLIVIVIIGILAAISIVAYNGVTQKARDDRRASNARNVVNALSSYQAENGTWPTGAGDAQTKLTGYSTVKIDSTIVTSVKSATPNATTEVDTLRLRVCSLSGSVVGIEVDYWKQETGAILTPSLKAGTTSGTGVTCAYTA